MFKGIVSLGAGGGDKLFQESVPSSVMGNQSGPIHSDFLAGSYYRSDWKQQCSRFDWSHLNDPDRFRDNFLGAFS